MSSLSCYSSSEEPLLPAHTTTTFSLRTQRQCRAIWRTALFSIHGIDKRKSKRSERAPVRRRTRLSCGPAIPIEAKTAQKDLNRGHSRGSRAERRTGAEMRISRGAVSPASTPTHRQKDGDQEVLLSCARGSSRHRRWHTAHSAQTLVTHEVLGCTNNTSSHTTIPRKNATQRNGLKGPHH